MIMMNGDCPVPGSSPSLPIPATLPSPPGVHEPNQFSNGPPPCTGCGQPISDEFILRVQGHLWHAQCLRCAACQASLTHTCYVRGTRVFCRMDFYRLFGACCAGCGEVVPPSDVVRRAHDNIYHMKCFVCVLCATPLKTGDQFYLRDDGRLICHDDFHTANGDCGEEQGDGNRPELQCQGRHQHQQQLPQQDQRPQSNLTSLTFTHQETEILREIYRACPNPSHDTLQRISNQHGLDMTRVRVWFHVNRKENGLRDCGMGHYSGGGCGGLGVERGVPPPGACYPVPIVNEVSCSSSGRLPTSSRSDIMGDVPFDLTSSLAGAKQPGTVWPISDDVWRSDFVPPNVDLNPCDIKNGEVCDNRRGLPAAGPSLPSSSSVSRGAASPGGGGHSGGGGDDFCGLSFDKGNNCQQAHLSDQDELSLSWINC